MDAAAQLLSACARATGGDTLSLPDWSIEDWHALVARCTAIHLKPGEVLIRRGDSDRALYFVCAGTLEVRGGGGSGETLGQLSRQRAGSVLGEVSLFDGRPRTASVWATVPAQLLRLEIDALHAFLHERPQRGHELLFALGRVLAFRLRRSEQRGKSGK